MGNKYSLGFSFTVRVPDNLMGKKLILKGTLSKKVNLEDLEIDIFDNELVTHVKPLTLFIGDEIDRFIFKYIFVSPPTCKAVKVSVFGGPYVVWGSSPLPIDDIRLELYSGA